METIRNKHRNNILNRFTSESLPHFVAKAVFFHMLCKLEHDIRTEWRVPNGYVDIVDLTTQTIYEMEFNVKPNHRAYKTSRYDMPGFDIVIVDCVHMPTDLSLLPDYFQKYIVPD